MREKLKARRKEMNYTQKSIAKKLGISIYTYQYIEQGRSFPREKLFNKIIKVLKIPKSEAYEAFENVEFPNENKTLKRGDVSRNICKFMNSKSKKVFTVHHVNAIRASILLEYKDRIKNEINIHSHTKEGKQKIFERVANIASDKYKIPIIAEDVRLYKNSSREEYCSRTGRTTWSIPSVRKKLGFNPTNGYQIQR